MDSRWIKNSKDKEAEKKRVESYIPAFMALQEILDEHFTKKEAVRDYGEPGWELRQVANNEYNAVLADIKKLIKIKD